MFTNVVNYHDLDIEVYISQTVVTVWPLEIRITYCGNIIAFSASSSNG